MSYFCLQLATSELIIFKIVVPVHRVTPRNVSQSCLPLSLKVMNVSSLSITCFCMASVKFVQDFITPSVHVQSLKHSLVNNSLV